VNALDILRVQQLEEVLAGVRIGGVPAQYGVQVVRSFQVAGL
jgi:hypothetical protein